MKFPKNKSNLYCVVRNTFPDESPVQIIIAGFADLEAAIDFRDACEQEWYDKVGTLEDVEFDVVLTTYYDA